jgi:GMP synthase-like glutamine amidotransferase
VRLGVLETGAPPERLRPQFGSYPEMFRALLGEGYDWSVYDLQAGRWPGRPEENDAYLITGSSAGVYDGDPWIARLLEFLREAKGKARLVGICFGHQAMAQAFGGEVIKSPSGWGIGLQSYDVRRSEPWMDPAKAFALPASHQDQVVQAPPTAVLLAASAFTPYAMFDYADQPAISIQPHPEFDPAYAEALIENRRGTRYTEAQADAAIASLHRPNDRARVGAWINRFLSAT